MSWQLESAALFGSALVVAKVTVILVAAFLGTRLLRRRTAAARHAVWAIAVGGALAVPLFTAAIPSWRVAVPYVSAGSAESVEPPPVAPALRTEDGAAASSHSAVATTSPAAGPGAPHTARAARTASSASLMVLLWLAGSLVLFASTIVRRVRLHRLAASAVPLTDAGLVQRVRQIAAEQGIGSEVRLLEGGRGVMPMTFGIARPALLLPYEARSWLPEKQDAVLRHELAHIGRRDASTQLLAELGCAVYWFHPLMWLATRQLRIEREHACDDAVLLAGARSSDYAAELLQMATTLHVRPRLSEAALAMARPSRLRIRIEALLDERARAARVPPAWLIPGGTLALVFIAALAVLTPAARAAIPTVPVPLPQGAEPIRAPDAASPVPAAPRPERTARADVPRADAARSARQTQTCLAGDGTYTVGTVVGGSDSRIVMTRVADSSVCMLTRGAVDFDASGTRIESLGPGAVVVLESRGPRGTRLLEISGTAAQPQHSWYVDGAPRGFDDAAQEWRDAMIGVLTLQWQVSMLRGREAGLRGRIASARGREASLRGEIASIRGREASMRGEIAAARGRTASLDGEIASMRGRVASMRGEIASIRGREASMRGEVSSLRARLSSLESAGRVSRDSETRAGLDREAEEIRRSIGEAERRLADYDGAARIAEIERNIDAFDLDRRVAEVEQRRPQEVDQRVREIEARIAEYNAASRIAEVERRMAGLDTEEEVARLEREIGSLDADRQVRALEQQLEPRLRRLRAALERAS